MHGAMAVEEEELSKHWKRLNLTTEENSIYHASHAKEYGSRQHCIIGKVLFGKALTMKPLGK